MFDLDNLTEEEREAIHEFLIPMGYKEGDVLVREKVVGGEIEEVKE